MITYEPENEYIAAQIAIEAERIQALEELDAWGWITPQEWMESYSKLQQAGAENILRFLRQQNLELGSAKSADLGSGFMGGAYGNNLGNWRTVDSIDCALRDRVRYGHITGLSLEQDEIISWLVAYLRSLVAHRIPDTNNRKFILDQLRKWSPDNLRDSSVTIETVDSLPPLLPLYNAGVQMGFKQEFGRSAEIEANSATLNRLMNGIGINKHTNAIQAVAAIDDFNQTVLPTRFATVQVLGDLMTKALEQIIKWHLKCMYDNNGRRLVINGRKLETQQVIQGLISDETGIEIYTIVGDLLPNSKKPFWQVARHEPYSLGQNPRMPEKHF
ncbi:MAG: hypothetical protein H6601_06775 [Flavobacteriales bacterium]|nr:hypothetical protein [Flavobacteriales bacterium]